MILCSICKPSNNQANWYAPRENTYLCDSHADTAVVAGWAIVPVSQSPLVLNDPNVQKSDPVLDIHETVPAYGPMQVPSSFYVGDPELEHAVQILSNSFVWIEKTSALSVLVKMGENIGWEILAKYINSKVKTSK